MIEILNTIENTKRVKKEQIIEICQSISDELVSQISIWLSSEDSKLVIIATSFIDELGNLHPEDCVQFKERLLELTQSKTNRICWGAMTALESFAQLIPDYLFENLALILKVLDNGSVVAKDHSMKILQKLSKSEQYSATTIPIMIDQLRLTAPNQVGQYSERTFDVIKPEYLDHFLEALQLRIAGLENHHHIRRLEELIVHVEKMK
jgi:hypothetical protein